jgi:P27 family predicted phage terminase small subunit
MTNPHRPSHLPEDVAAVWEEVTAAYGDNWNTIAGPALEAYCGQVAVLRDATARIARDGLIVEGPKGEPITHPAVAIQRAAQDEIRRWGDTFKPPRRYNQRR